MRTTRTQVWRRCLLAVAVLTGCDDYDFPVTPGGAGAFDPGTPEGPPPSTGERGLLPCDVEAIVVTRCQSCHGDTPKNYAPMSLVTWADLQRPSPLDPSMTVGEKVAQRVASETRPMPPKPAATLPDAQVGVLESWVAAGMPQQVCSDGPGPTGPTPSSGEKGLLPCDVEAVLVTRCQSCHGETPKNDAPMSLVTWDDLQRPAGSNPDVTVAEHMIARIISSDFPMPPAPAAMLAGDQVATLSVWVAEGAPQERCDEAPVGPTPSTGEKGLLPCDVESILVTRCQSCHGETPKNDAPMSMVTWADLQQPAPSNPSATVAEQMVARVASTSFPMPPAPAAMLSSDQVATLSAWVAGGAAQAQCGEEPPGPVEPPPSTGETGLLPCDVEALLADRCRTCHSDPPAQDAPMPLITLDDLLRPAQGDPSRTVAEYAAIRMADSAFPMPPSPAPRVPGPELAAFEAWVAAGTPAGACEPTPDPFDVDPTCSSDQWWDHDDDDGSPRMFPGRACINCHTEERADGEDDAPMLRVGGTVYPTAHEPNNCYGVEDARVVITDAEGRVFELETNRSGNFLLENRDARDFTYPFTAKVLYEGRERVMNTPQMTGDCNGCHTQWGENDAPGRILLP